MVCVFGLWADHIAKFYRLSFVLSFLPFPVADTPIPSFLDCSICYDENQRCQGRTWHANAPLRCEGFAWWGRAIGMYSFLIMIFMGVFGSWDSACRIHWSSWWQGLISCPFVFLIWPEPLYPTYHALYPPARSEDRRPIVSDSPSSTIPTATPPSGTLLELFDYSIPHPTMATCLMIEKSLKRIYHYNWSVREAQVIINV